jgi:hypothetical protein
MRFKVKNHNLEKKVDEIFEPVMITLVIVLVFILVLPVFWSLSPQWQKIFSIADLIIWVAFYLEILTKLIVSRNRLKTLEKNWLTVIVLFAPIFRIFRLIRIVQILRVARLLRLRTLESRLEKTARKIFHATEKILVLFFEHSFNFFFLNLANREERGRGYSIF